MGKLEEILDRFGDLIDKETAEELAEYASAKFTKISKLYEGRVNVKGRVSGIGDPENANEIYISDETGRVRVFCCREIYYRVDIGSFVEIINAEAKFNGKNFEIHLNKNSKVRFLE